VKHFFVFLAPLFAVALHRIDSPIFITTDNTVLHGHATIVQTNPDADIFRVENTNVGTSNPHTAAKAPAAR